MGGAGVMMLWFVCWCVSGASGGIVGSCLMSSVWSLSEVNVQRVFLYFICISLLRSELAFTMQLNPCRGAWYLVQCSDFLVTGSRWMASTCMPIWMSASRRTSISRSPCWAPRAIFASGAWHWVVKLLWEIRVQVLSRW
jgi:hypothetical protein